VSELKVKVQQSNVGRAADGSWPALRGTRDGAAFSADWIQALILEGRGFGAGIGLLSAGEALPAAAITTLRPQLWVRVPNGTAIIPFYAAVQVEDTGATGNFEVSLGISPIDAGNGTSSAADYGPVALRTDAPISSNCTCRQEATGDVTAASDPTVELWRVFKAEDNAATPATGGNANFVWEPEVCPVVVGAGTLHMAIGSSAAPTVTAQIQWVEVPESAIT
jgi:hypothetical protein